VTLDDALDCISALVRPDGSTWIEHAAPWQLRDAATILDPDAPPHTFVMRRRGASKTEDGSVWAIGSTVALFPPGSTTNIGAADRDQARFVLDSLAGFVQRTPMLRDRFEVASWKATDLHTGSSIVVLSADAASSWGLRPRLAILDELCWWPESRSARTFYTSISSAVAKMGGKLAIISTPSSPNHWSFGTFTHAQQDPLWNVLVTKDKTPWLSEARIAEQSRQHPEVMVRRLFGVEWVEDEGLLTTRGALERCIALDGPLGPQPGRSYVISLDVGLVHDRTAIAICHGEPVTGEDGETRTKVVLDRLHLLAGTRAAPVQLQTVEDYIREAARAYRPATVVYDPFQSVQLAQRLSGRSIVTRQFNFTSTSVSKIAVVLHSLIRDGLLAIPNEPELVDELSAVRLRETSPGSFRLDHDPDKHDHMAVALALAAEHLTDRAPRDYPGIAGIEIERDSGSGWRTEYLGGRWDEARAW
jgi:hypothetical protein